MIDNEPAAFPMIYRDEERLVQTPARIVVQLPNDSTLPRALFKMKTTSNIKLAQLDAAIFAFEPFLRRLQDMQNLPLARETLGWEHGEAIDGPSFQPRQLIRRLENQCGEDLKDLLNARRSVNLDASQMESLCSSLSQRLSLVQGPPGTGKSFIGALVAKALHDFTSQVILVVCFTNHALDQFTEDLLDNGIPSTSIIRLGGKCTDRTKPLTMRENSGGKLGSSHWAQIDKVKQKLFAHESRIKKAFARYRYFNVQKHHIMEYLEFLSGDLPFFEAFTVPKPKNDGMTQIGRRGKAVDQFYLLDRWSRCEKNAGFLQHMQPRGAAGVWNMTSEMRQAALNRWHNAILDDLVTEIQDAGRQFNSDQAEVDRIFGERDASIIKQKRIIACTTNGAAKFASAIQAASPGVVLVEEAGEILEAHILTSLGPHTEQLIMIGDHKQLRPKCSYELSVEQGDGFDLNRSLFERLVLKGFPHVTLTEQHRMRPEISTMIRRLTYPDLIDAKSTLNRPSLRGFRDSIVFVNHSHSEIELKNARELKDGKTSSKQNEFEGQMILKCVRYLAQQGYGSDNLVVLTPYLGQLKLLRDQLAEANDPILNDLDKFDLVRAGLLTDLSSKTSKPSLRISTIDNYQGEESDIVLVSLTRSNQSHDIGFMAVPERLNVLLSRARDALILIGNSETFINARKGRELWRKFFDMLKKNDHIYEGFPLKCEKHPDRTALLSSPDDFEVHCPDGGCKEHVCPTCERVKKEAEKKAQKALKEKQRRDENIQKHLSEIAKVEEEIEQLNQRMQDARLVSEHQNILAQKRKDLATAKQRERKARNLAQDDSPSVCDDVDYGDDDRTQTDKKSSPKKSPQSNKGSEKKYENLKDHIRTALDNIKSPSLTEWQRQKDQENSSNAAIDKIMEMIGLEDVKSQVLRIKAKVETCTRQGTDLKKERLGLVLQGNPGTGKTTVARHYARVLTSLGALPGGGFIETTGSRLAHGGVAEAKDHLKQLENSEGGVYFIDEAYQLAEGHNYGGKTVLDFLLAEIENLMGKIVFVFAGYRKQMEKFFEHNPGFASRIPFRFHFEDYTDDELLKMVQFQMKQFYQAGVAIEGGLGGLYMRIAIRRLGRSRGRDGFGNARAVENMFARIRERQSDRLFAERRAGLTPDDLIIKKEDLIGPDPSEAVLKCKAWEQLQKLTGLRSVKDSVKVLIDLIKSNYERELAEQPLVEMPLNRVFLGSPGTGKTSVAKLYGRILADVGLLSDGEVVVKNPADFIGSVIGQSESNTKAILENTVGKVLIIDEAYMLHSSGAGGSTNGADMYKTAVIDTMVAEIQSVPGEDRCVLLLGYEAQMVEMFQNVNPGLSRRFRIQDAFRFEDFNDSELEEILQLKLKDQGLGATASAVAAAIDALSRARNGMNFGNGGDVENLISTAKSNYQARQSALPPQQRSTDFVFEPQDFDLDYDRATGAETNLQQVFKDVIGCESIISLLDGFLKVAKGMRVQGLDPRGDIPMNFIFKGPPGTGKTSTARKFGQVYYDLGFLSTVEVVECSATDLIGQYVGQTGPKTIKQLERGLGKVLFVDEAYRLGEGMFAQEAVNELVDTMTKPRFAGKLVIILAGYENDMNNLLRANEGLSSRFADEIIFPALSSENCLRLLEARLKHDQIAVPLLQDPKIYQELSDSIVKLSKLPSWGNARDIQTLAKSMVRAVYQNVTGKADQLILPPEIALSCLQTMLSDRSARVIGAPRSRPSFPAHAQTLSPPPMDTPKQTPHTNAGTSTATEAAPQHSCEHDEIGEKRIEENNMKRQAAQIPTPTSTPGQQRDAGVSDAIWDQLQHDETQAELQAQQFEHTIQVLEEKAKAHQLLLTQEAEDRQPRITHPTDIDAKAKAKVTEAAHLQALKEREESRIRALEAAAELEQLKRAESERKQQEARAQQKLRRMGICPAGFSWVKQQGGYRCRGGSHWVSDSALGDAVS